MPIIINPFTGQFDITGTSGGGSPSTPFAVSFTTGNFVLVVDQYIFTVTAASHQKTQPTATVYEENGVDFDEVEVSIKVLANNDVQLIVPQTPDLRFDGKIVIN